MKSFLTGLGVGIAIGIMYAPRRGSEIRGKVRDLAGDSVKKTRESKPVGNLSELIARPSSRPSPNWRDVLSEGRKPATPTTKLRTERVAVPDQDVVRAAPASFLSIVNDWPHERLIEIDGIGPVLATKIISNRPYKNAEELAKSKLLPPSAIEALRKAG